MRKWAFYLDPLLSIQDIAPQLSAGLLIVNRESPGFHAKWVSASFSCVKTAEIPRGPIWFLYGHFLLVRHWGHWSYSWWANMGLLVNAWLKSLIHGRVNHQNMVAGRILSPDWKDKKKISHHAKHRPNMSHSRTRSKQSDRSSSSLSSFPDQMKAQYIPWILMTTFECLEAQARKLTASWISELCIFQPSFWERAGFWGYNSRSCRNASLITASMKGSPLQPLN